MARAYGEALVQDIHGNVIPGVPVDLIDPATNVRLLATVFKDSTSATTLALPLITDANGKAPFYLAAGGLVITRATINGATYDDLIAVVDPTASVGDIGGAVAPHTHVESDVTSLPTDLSGKAPLAHAHVEGDVTNLATDLANKAAAAHGHVEADVTNLAADLSGKSAVGHTHSEANVANLTTDLAATEKTVNKNANSGYAGLDSAGHIGVTRINPSATNGQVLTTVAGAAAWAASTGGGANAPWQFSPDFQAPASGDYAQMRCSVATSITAFHAQRTGGTGANMDVLKNGVSILTAPLSLTATTDTTGTLVTNPTTFAIGDILKIVVSAQTGNPSDIMASAEGSRVTF